MPLLRMDQIIRLRRVRTAFRQASGLQRLQCEQESPNNAPPRWEHRCRLCRHRAALAGLFHFARHTSVRTMNPVCSSLGRCERSAHRFPRDERDVDGLKTPRSRPLRYRQTCKFRCQRVYFRLPARYWEMVLRLMARSSAKNVFSWSSLLAPATLPLHVIS